MHLIDEIVAELTSSSPDLSAALLKTKVLLHQMGEKEISRWVDSELKGYASGDDVPAYRQLSVEVFGAIANGVYRYPEVPIPISKQLPENVKRNMKMIGLTQGIASVEKFDTEDDSHIIFPIPPELYPLMSKVFRGGYTIERAWAKPPTGFSRQLITEIKTRLLDFLLDLSAEIPQDLPAQELSQIQKSVNVKEMFRNTVFGDGATIIIGHDNVQNVASEIHKNDFQSLSRFLRENNLPEEDIASLREAVTADEDAPEHSNNEYGKAVALWLKTTIQKAGTAAWDVGVGIASNLLTKALEAFYGW